jgi:hypothetical protein
MPRAGSYEVYLRYPLGSGDSAGAPIGVRTTEGIRALVLFPWVK